MPKKPGTKVHTRIGHDRALCGLAPESGHYNIVSFCSFFTASPENQCGRCTQLLQERGYNVEALRLRYRTAYDHAQELALTA